MPEPEFGPPPPRRTSKILVIAVVCVAAGGLLAMRYLSPRDAAAGDPEIDRKIDEVLEREARNPTTPGPVVTIPGGPVAPEGPPPRDPFAAKRAKKKDPPPAANPKAARRQEIERALQNLQLQAVMTGSHPVATISGRPVGLDRVFKVSAGEGRPPVELRVTSISAGSVTLQATDPDLGLTVERTLHLKRP